MTGRERAFLWSDYDAGQAINNLTVLGFLEAINKTFDANTPTRTGMSVELDKIPMWTAIENKLLDEPMMDLIARQMKFPAWEYVGKYNLVAPFDTVLKRKQEMLRHVVRLMEVRGTPYSVAEALRAFGFTSVSIIENVSLDFKYDGTYNYDGTMAYFGNFEHNLFNVELTTILDLVGPPDEQVDAIVSIVNAFKKYRPELYQVIIHTPSVPSGTTRTVWEGI